MNVNARLIAPTLSIALLLAGCSTPLRQPGATFDRVGQEMKDAAASGKPAGNDAINAAMMPSLDMGSTPVAGTEHRFDLAVNGASAAQVFMAIVSGTRFSMLVPPEVTGTISLNLKNVTVREALETIRDMYGYDFNVKGTRIFIQPNTLQTRIFQINYLSSRRQGVTDTRVTSSSPSVVNPGGSSGGTSGGGSTAAPQPTQQGGAGQLSSSSADSSRVQTRSDADFWKDLGSALTTIVGTGDGRSVILNAHSGVVLVKGMPSDIRSVENYLKATQVIVERQVMLEAKIVEVTLSESYQTGVNWAHFGGSNNRYAYGSSAPGTTLNTTGAITGSAGGITGSGLSGFPATASTTATVTPGTAGALAASAVGKGFFGLALQTANFAALLSFLESQGDMQVLSSPRVATINNQKAVLKVGTDDYYVTNISTSTTASGSSTVTSPTITLQPFFSGVALDVTPQIDDDGNVLLHVHPSVTVVQEKNKVVDLGTLGNFTLPLASSSINETDAIVRVQDGYIVAIGGLMSQEQVRDNNGLAGASSLPGIGALFGQRGGLLRKRELVVLIKPTIIQNEQSWKQDLLDTQERIEKLDPRNRTPRAQ
ncbi:MAG: pilus (MSHA type) biogenesis protein MshL [Betaproteobacteria bacterium]|uniref:Pilus (MSHA type) biogenesis protein MshL n=1 Tax=Candidatus Proximibacter danicus TaxID=2954365 RepID=A0A9D7K216_9PROT|nr:pilus (MSHA type) biogenesis protein MshL [Candidatus Proximibacter danicus]MBK9444936.1 pilus (MSHA type) biogenesis protein MshL [Betaproteobacteria bacterium]